MKEILLFSLPTIAASLMEPLSQVVDTALIGHLETKSLAALTIGATLLSSFTWIFNFLIHASTQSAAMASEDRIGAKIRQSLTVAMGVGLISGAILYLFRNDLYLLFTKAEVKSDLIDEYFVTRILGHPIALCYMTALSLLRGLGLVNRALIFVAVTTLINLFLTWLFIYPLQFGLKGAALGTVLSHAFGLALLAWAFYKNHSVRSSFWHKVIGAEWFEFGKNSSNLFIRSMAITGSLFVAAKIAGSISTIALASHQILLQAWLFTSFFIDGVAMTATIKGAEAVKNRNVQKFKFLHKKIMTLTFILGVIFSLAYFIFEHSIASLFTSDPDVLAQLALVWLAIALSQVTNAISFSYDGLLFGLGSVGGFRSVRNVMVMSCLLGFLPFILKQTSLTSLWYGLITMNILRMILGYIETQRLTGRMA